MRTFTVMIITACLTLGFGLSTGVQGQPRCDSSTEVSRPASGDEPSSSGDGIRGDVVSAPQWTHLRRFIGSRVLSGHGDTLGWVDNFTFDAHGRIEFVIVSSPGPFGVHKKLVAVPWAAITKFSFPAGDHLILRMEKQEFAAAPSFSKADFKNETWAGNAYRFFGQHPAWVEPTGIGSNP
jgi:hypothetical protein